MEPRSGSVCPVCRRGVGPRPENAAFPFCSAQCKLVDLGRWLDGSYRVPGPPDASMMDALEAEERHDPHLPEEEE